MRKIPLTQGQFAIVDDEDFEDLNKNKWFASYSDITKSFYAKRSHKGTTIYMHRQIMKPEKGVCIDHINHNTLNNKKNNLRVATVSQNAMNQGMRKTNTSGFKGVSWDKRRSKWVAQIKANKKGKHLGYFSNIEDAVEARRKAEAKYYGEYLHPIA